jgi:hypothetical protein
MLALHLAIKAGGQRWLMYITIYIYTYYPYYINGAPKGLDTLEMMVDIFKTKAD